MPKKSNSEQEGKQIRGRLLNIAPWLPAET